MATPVGAAWCWGVLSWLEVLPTLLPPKPPGTGGPRSSSSSLLEGSLPWAGGGFPGPGSSPTCPRVLSLWQDAFPGQSQVPNICQGQAYLSHGGDPNSSSSGRLCSTPVTRGGGHRLCCHHGEAGLPPAACRRLSPGCGCSTQCSRQPQTWGHSHSWRCAQGRFKGCVHTSGTFTQTGLERCPLSPFT